MFKYKREMNNYDRAKNLEYSFSDNEKLCFCMSGTLKSSKPYHGMFIKDSKVLLENLVETFNIDNNMYKIVELDTKTKELSMRQYEKAAESSTEEYKE